MSPLNDAIVREAREWLGTPFRHQASVKHAGCDCLGLVRGVWREVIGPEPEIPRPYTPDWADVTGDETLLNAARRHLVEAPIGSARAGDVLLFRMALGGPARHAAILIGDARVIHAYWGRSVVETRLGPWWRRRIAAAFSFPQI